MYEWDENKRRENIAKHGVDFVEMDRFEWETAVTRLDDRFDEIRFRSIGYIGDRLYVVSHTSRDENIRIISLRKANNREIRDYAKT